MKIKPFLLLVLLALVGCANISFADLSTTDIVELNNATPGTSKVSDNNNAKGLGNLIKGRFVNGVYTGTVDANSPSTTISSSTLAKWNIPTTSYGISLGNGVPGQNLTIVKNNTGTTAGKITPTTKTGFTDITLTNQGDGVELRYVDDTTGWVVAGAFGGASTVGKVNP